MMMTSPPPPPIPYPTKKHASLSSKHSGVTQKYKSTATPKSDRYSDSLTSTLPPAYSPLTYGSSPVGKKATKQGRGDNKPANWSASASSMQMGLLASNPLSAPSPHPSAPLSQHHQGSFSAASAFSSPAPPSGPFAGGDPGAMFGAFGSLAKQTGMASRPGAVFDRQEEEEDDSGTPFVGERYKSSRPQVSSSFALWDIF
jgi:hypothetical protein